MIISGTNPETVISKANNVLCKLKSWYENNYFHLNTDKSKAVLFQLHSGTRLNLYPPLNYGLDIINYTDHVKTLGEFFFLIICPGMIMFNTFVINC